MMPPWLTHDTLDTSILLVFLIMTLMVLWIITERLWFFAQLEYAQFSREDSLELALTRYLSMLSALASNAPYVGLLGTVLGIMMALYEVGMSGQLEPSKIMVGLALALKATALGLLVAIPSMMIYSACLRKVDLLMGKWEDARA